MAGTAKERRGSRIIQGKCSNVRFRGVGQLRGIEQRFALRILSDAGTAEVRSVQVEKRTAVATGFRLLSSASVARVRPPQTVKVLEIKSQPCF